jgi:hypothetical protein
MGLRPAKSAVVGRHFLCRNRQRELAVYRVGVDVGRRSVILYLSYEEVQALRQGARSFLRDEGSGSCAVAAPPTARAEVSALEERLVGDLDVETLAEQRSLASAMAPIVECLRIEMETAVGETHPAHEGAVAAYFEYAHSLSVLARLREIGGEMEALIEVVTGKPADAATASSFQFPD